MYLKVLNKGLPGGIEVKTGFPPVRVAGLIPGQATKILNASQRCVT